MAHINWDKPFFIDPTTGESVPPLTPGAIPFPTYGHYGGGNYSAGVFGGALITQPGGIPYSFAMLNAVGTPDQDAVDIIDYFSYVHDVRSSQTGPVYNALQAQADAQLLASVVAVDSHFDPEAALYAGSISLGMIGSLALHGFLNVLSPFQLLGALTDAVKDIDYGLDHLPPAELADALNFIFEPTGDPHDVVPAGVCGSDRDEHAECDHRRRRGRQRAALDRLPLPWHELLRARVQRDHRRSRSQRGVTHRIIAAGTNLSCASRDLAVTSRRSRDILSSRGKGSSEQVTHADPEQDRSLSLV